MELDFAPIKREQLIWKETRAEGLNLDYTCILPQSLANKLMASLEDIAYFTGDLAKVQVYGRWHQIPRQQAAFGDPGLTYKFSGKTIPALPWRSDLLAVRDLLFRLIGHNFNFVLVNRYRNGDDHMGEHRDNEEELDPTSPIASLSLGQARDFILRHADARKSGAAKRKIPKGVHEIYRLAYVSFEP